MAVGTKQGFSGDAKPFHMNRVADTIAGTTVPDAKLLARAVQEAMIVGILEICLDQIVIDILR